MTKTKRTLVFWCNGEKITKKQFISWSSNVDIWLEEAKTAKDFTSWHDGVFDMYLYID